MSKHGHFIGMVLGRIFIAFVGASLAIWVFV